MPTDRMLVAAASAAMLASMNLMGEQSIEAPKAKPAPYLLPTTLSRTATIGSHVARLNAVPKSEGGDGY